MKSGTLHFGGVKVSCLRLLHLAFEESNILKQTFGHELLVFLYINLIYLFQSIINYFKITICVIFKWLQTTKKYIFKDSETFISKWQPLKRIGLYIFLN